VSETATALASRKGFSVPGKVSVRNRSKLAGSQMKIALSAILYLVSSKCALMLGPHSNSKNFFGITNFCTP
jgi:hypothetical protein